MGEDRGAEGEAVAVGGPEEGPTGSGCPRPAAQRVPRSTEELRLIRIRSGHTQGIHEGVCYIYCSVMNELFKSCDFSGCRFVRESLSAQVCMNFDALCVLYTSCVCVCVCR